MKQVQDFLYDFPLFPALFIGTFLDCLQETDKTSKEYP